MANNLLLSRVSPQQLGYLNSTFSLRVPKRGITSVTGQFKTHTSVTTPNNQWLCHRRRNFWRRGLRIPWSRLTQLRTSWVLGICIREEFQHEPDKDIDWALFRKVDTHPRENAADLSEEQPWLGLEAQYLEMSCTRSWSGGGSRVGLQNFSQVFLHLCISLILQGHGPRFATVSSASRWHDSALQWLEGVSLKIPYFSLFILNP